MRYAMKAVQMTLDEELIQAVDQLSRKLGTSRSAFTRKALREALDRHRIDQLEQKQIQGYKKHPVAPDEFAAWEEEQVWVE